MVAMDAYAAFMVGVCHTLGSPLGALLSNVSLAREDLADLAKALREGTHDPALLRPIVERAQADLGDAQKLIDRLKHTLIEVRSSPSEADERVATHLLDIFESAAKFAISAAFRNARVTTKVVDEAKREEFVVRGTGSLVLRLVLGTFAVAGSMVQGHADRARFQMDLESVGDRVRLRIEGFGTTSRVDEIGFQTFAELFRYQGGHLSREVLPESCVVLAEFARYSET